MSRVVTGFQRKISERAAVLVMKIVRYGLHPRVVRVSRIINVAAINLENSEYAIKSNRKKVEEKEGQQTSVPFSNR